MRLTQISLDGKSSFGKLAVWSKVEEGWILVVDLLGGDVKEATSISVIDVLQGTFYVRGGSFNRKSELVTLDCLGQLIKEYDEMGGGRLHVYKPWNDSSSFAQLFKPTGKILCVGLNYADHVKEFGDSLPEEPVIFNKASTSINYAGAQIILPSVSNRVDFEGELVVVVGKEGKNISENEAMNYVAGYCCGNDVSARDWQKDKPAGQWFLGKSFDTFAVVGPCLVTADEVGNPNNLKIETRLNGVVMQSSSTKKFIFKIERLISYISQVMTLNIGDLIYTGTPDGVGDVRKPPIYLKKGDEIVVEIEKVGLLINHIR